MALKFDLSTISQNATVNSAKVRIYKHGNFSMYRQPAEYDIHLITTDWSESSANWTTPWTNEGGDYDANKIETYYYPGNYNGWIEYTVTDAVQEMVEGTLDNYGFIIMDTKSNNNTSSNQDQESYLHSKEASNQLHPELVVDYDVSSAITVKSNYNSILLKDITSTGNTITFTSATKQEISLYLHSATGRLILNRRNIRIDVGKNAIILPKALSKGIFILTLYSGNDKGIYTFFNVLH